MSGRLTEGFRDIIELRWSDFVEQEQSLDATNFDSIVTSLVRACMKGNLRAIQTSLDRLDGKVATEIKVEYPKFYTLYPMATKTADDPKIIEGDDDYTVKLEDGKLTHPATDGIVTLGSGAPADMEELAIVEDELPTGSLRVVLEKMLDSPKSVVDGILATAAAVDDGFTSRGDPMVKSVIVAGLLKLVHEGRISAVFEVFDQIDGKVAETVKIFGDDVYLTNYATVAPAGAVKNENGIYQIAADNVTNAWAARLEDKYGKTGR